jgi:hypothetical protein
MDNYRIPNRVLGGKFFGRRPVEDQERDHEELIVAAKHRWLKETGRLEVRYTYVACLITL